MQNNRKLQISTAGSEGLHIGQRVKFCGQNLPKN